MTKKYTLVVISGEDMDNALKNSDPPFINGVNGFDKEAVSFVLYSNAKPPLNIFELLKAETGFISGSTSLGSHMYNVIPNSELLKCEGKFKIRRVRNFDEMRTEIKRLETSTILEQHGIFQNPDGREV